MASAEVRKDSAPGVDLIETTSAANMPHHETTGTVQLVRDGNIVLIPTPSPDPKDPLNLPSWHKAVIIFLVGLYSAFAVLATSGLGAVFPEVAAMYPGQEARATDLLTYPTLFMGIGNLLSMPLCVAIGRRPVFLISLLTFVASGIWCACSKSLGSHIAARDILSMAAGQSEALAPLMVQEIHFLHERGLKLSWFIAVQIIGTSGMFVATTYLVPAWGIAWWYGIITIIMGAVLIMSILFVVETKYDRPPDANEGEVHLHFDEEGHIITKGGLEKIVRATTNQSVHLEPERYGPRTWRHSLKIIHHKPDWKAMVSFYKDTAKGLAIPTIFWLTILNGAFLGVYVFQASTFANILQAAPYNFESGWLGYIQLAQIIDCAVMVPLLGYGSDLLVNLLSRAHNGIYEPEYRLITLSIPVVGVIVSCVIFGRAGAHPNAWNWSAVAVTYNVGYFAFLGANLVGITYAVDSFPDHAGPLLLLICAGRGFISFGLGYSTVPLVSKIGYESMNIFAIICGVLGGMGILAFVLGRPIRVWANKKIWRHE